MRTDIKVGIVVGVIIVAVAGYLFYRSGDEGQIPLGEPVAGQAQESGPDEAIWPLEEPKPVKEPPAESPALPRPAPAEAVQPVQARPPAVEPGRREVPVAPAPREVTPPEQEPPAAEPPSLLVEPTPPSPKPTPAAPGVPSGLVETPVPPEPTGAPTSRIGQTGPEESPSVPGFAKPVTRPAKPALPARPKERPAVRTHIVQPGDTISGLAEKYYGSQRYIGFLLEANPQVKDPRRLQVNTKLTIPPLPEQGAVPAPGASKGAGPAARTYRVQPGDTFYRIAEKVFGDGRRWPEIFELNKDKVGEDPYKLRAGQLIELPSPEGEDSNRP